VTAGAGGGLGAAGARNVTFAEIRDGWPVRRLRQNLLEGTLDDNCGSCPSLARIPVAEQVSRVRESFVVEQATVYPGESANVAAAPIA